MRLIDADKLTIDASFFDDEKDRAFQYVSMEQIKDAPTIEDEPIKHGKWKRVSADKYVQHAYAFYRCSECGEDIIGEHNYCPNCGAKMEVEK